MVGLGQKNIFAVEKSYFHPEDNIITEMSRKLIVNSTVERYEFKKLKSVQEHISVAIYSSDLAIQFLKNVGNLDS